MRVAALLAVVVAALSGCTADAPQVDVRGVRLQPSLRNYPLLTGYVVNASDRPVTSADVSVTLYGEDNVPLGEEMVQVRAIAAGDSARFERRLDRPAMAARVRHVTVN